MNKKQVQQLRSEGIDNNERQISEIVNAINEAPYLATYIYKDVERQFGVKMVEKVKKRLREQD